MGRGHSFLDRLAEESDLPSELLPGRTIVELAGDSRVLIENHFGIKAYSLEKVVINVSFGQLSVCGHCLDILRMTKEQLIIRGEIHGIAVQRRK